MKKLLYGLMLLTMPVMIYAESNISLSVAIFAELFCSIHMTVFVLWPLAKLITKDSSKVKYTVIKLFLIRVVILIILDMISPSLFFLDFFAIFIGAFILIPIMMSKEGKKTIGVIKSVGSTSGTIASIAGMPTSQDAAKELQKRVGLKFAKANEFDQMYLMSENDMLDTYIERELKNSGYDKKSIPFDMVKRRIILNLIFVFLLFIYIVMIFFHFPIYTYIIGFIILIVYFKLSRRFNIVKFIHKEITARPSDNMKNIIASVMSNCTEDSNRSLLWIGSLVAIILPMIMFINPVILYEEADGGYYVRYYAWGLKNYKTANIPEKHNGKDVIGLRGNTFSNMYFLESAELPNTIKVMRGQTFKNCSKLKSIKLPSNLEYLGGGAFYNCRSLEGIVIPDSVSEIGGEAFTNCTSLKEVVLPEKITEIRGNTFEGCISLENIRIPSSVTRIGGHAFYDCSSLSSVIIERDTKLVEIGSSAFRRCDSLYQISLPRSVSINSRAFKESPTTINYFEDFIDVNAYKNQKLDFKTGESKSLVINNNKEKISIKFDNVEDRGNSKYRFDFIITGAVERYFSLNNDGFEKITINDHLAFELDYYTSDYVILKAYYD